MPRLNSFGKYILSAGEISSYIVCPKSWHLEYVENQKPKHEKSKQEGSKLHVEWLIRANEALFFTWGTRLIIYMLMLIILVYIFALDIK